MCVRINHSYKSARKGTRGCLPRRIEVSTVKHEQVLVVGTDALDRVGKTLGEIPDVAVVERLCLVYTILIDGRDLDGTVVEEAPFSLR